MIFIDLFGNPPPQTLIDEGVALTRQLMELLPEDRDAFIEKHKSYWGKLKEHYKELSSGKCWYTEAKDISSYYHMDHFRPKKATKVLKKWCTIPTDNNPEAYWWLAFDWENYRYSSSIPNTSKNAYFPLKAGTPIAHNKVELSEEWPGLIDPTDPNDVMLIAFNEAGEVCPACTYDDDWHSKRVKLSIRVYDLNNISLVEARKQIQNQCERKIRNLINIRNAYPNTNSSEFRKVFKECILELRSMIKPEAELSSVARNYIRNHPEEFIRNIVS
jgi:hypothetical protein